MAAFDDDDFAEVERQTPKAEVVRQFRRSVMLDVQRATMYSTFAALVRAGMSVGDATELLHGEYESREDWSSAQAVKVFFSAVDTARSSSEDLPLRMASIAEAAVEAFGAKFIGAEEMALLKAMVPAHDVAALLGACSGLLEQYQSQRLAGHGASLRRAV